MESLIRLDVSQVEGGSEALCSVGFSCRTPTSKSTSLDHRGQWDQITQNSMSRHAPHSTELKLLAIKTRGETPYSCLFSLSFWIWSLQALTSYLLGSYILKVKHADARYMTPSRNTRSYTLRSVPSSPGRSFFFQLKEGTYTKTSAPIQILAKHNTRPLAQGAVSSSRSERQYIQTDAVTQTYQKHIIKGQGCSIHR